MWYSVVYRQCCWELGIFNHLKALKILGGILQNILDYWISKDKSDLSIYLNFIPQDIGPVITHVSINFCLITIESQHRMSW